jgi:hypothetical protein
LAEPGAATAGVPVEATPTAIAARPIAPATMAPAISERDRREGGATGWTAATYAGGPAGCSAGGPSGCSVGAKSISKFSWDRGGVWSGLSLEDARQRVGHVSQANLNAS